MANQFNGLTPAQVAGATTAQVDFWNATPSGQKLFSVRAGVPLGDAFDQLSLLLSVSKSLVDDVCIAVSADEQPQGHWAASHMLEFSYVLVRAMHDGLTAHEREGQTKSSESHA